MALLHRAEIHPTKLELLAAWLPSRPWYRGPAGADVATVSACRFDDPAGEVGIEMIFVQAGGGPVHHVPLTYRGAPREGGEEWLVGTTEHSVLGRRWVYDACGDPVYAAALAGAILTGTGQAEEFIDVGGRLEPRTSRMTVTGSGTLGAEVPTIDAIRRVDDEDPTIVVTDPVELVVVRTVNGDSAPTSSTLTGTWAGLPAPVLLAYARLR
jgi:hypothetical protein